MMYEEKLARMKPTYFKTDTDIVAYKIVDKKMTCTLDGYVHTKHGYSLPVHEPGKTIRATVASFDSMAKAAEFTSLSNDSVPLRCVIPKGSIIAIDGRVGIGPRARIMSNCLHVDKILSWQDAFDQLAVESNEWFFDNARNIPTIEYNFPNVTYLSFMNSSISGLPSSVIGLTGLRGLSLEYTQIEEVPKAVYSLTSLDNLNLSGTRIRSVSNNITRLEKLEYLDLSETLIESLPEEIFKMKSLRSLNLSRCKNLHNIPRLPRLDELFLDSVVLESIDDELLDPLLCCNISLRGATIKSLTDKQMDAMMSENCGAYDYWRVDKMTDMITIGGNQNDE